MAKPIICYYGGKRLIANKIVPLIKDNLAEDGTYYEPFVGGGAIWLALEHDKNVVADVVPDLINMYQCVRDNPDQVYFHLSKLPNSKDHYYKIRNFDRNPNFKRTSKEFQAARFIYTCLAAFGSTRYNSKGQMNQSYFHHPERKILKKKEDFYQIVDVLQHTKIMRQSFEETLKLPQKGDFVYLDPPYIDTKYDQYWKDKFKLEDMKKLKDCCDELTKRGVKFALSHSENEEVDKLFQDYNRYDLTVHRCIKYTEFGNGKNENEYLITNF